MSDAPPPKERDAGAPAWVMTFADLMSLLMCFFVLLLAFSEMDVLKFKQIAGSMSHAFGVQREIKAKEIPKGINIIAKEFSPGKPDPTTMNEIRQHTTDDHDQTLKLEEGKGDDSAGEGKGEGDGSGGEGDAALQQVYVQVQADMSDILEALKEEIDKGLVDIETQKNRIIIRIQEKASFPSGTANLRGDFQPVINKISDVLKRTSGQLVIAGHTDDLPISTERFRSNWELSAARAVSVLHHILTVNDIDPSRFVIEGYAESRPLVPNDSPENRARNRRVEIVVVKGLEFRPSEVGTVIEDIRGKT